MSQQFGPEQVLREISFTLERGRTLSILGRSGCGKTTLLKSIAGLHPLVQGRVRLGEREITTLPPERRGVVYLYQEPLLFPHLDVAGNVAFGLELRRLERGAISSAVEKMLDQLELGAHARKRPDQLSGGQRQRVAFGRALIVGPALLLLDEPFSALDRETRATMQQLFKRVVHQLGITALFVTHSLKEALLMGDAWGLLDEGRLTVFATRQQFIAAPQSGIAREVAFWRGLEEGDRDQPL